jgi:hypothetical protein
MACKVNIVRDENFCIYRIGWVVTCFEITKKSKIFLRLVTNMNMFGSNVLSSDTFKINI